MTLKTENLQYLSNENMVYMDFFMNWLIILFKKIYLSFIKKTLLRLKLYISWKKIK